MTRRLERVGHEVVSRTVERVLNSTANAALPTVRPEVLAFHDRATVVDLLVGSAVFRREFVTRQPGGHADIPRMLESGVDLIGLTIATRHPDLRGTLSTPQFRALGFPMSRLHTNMAIAGAVARRIRRWERESGGRLRVIDAADEFGRLAHGGDPTNQDGLAGHGILHAFLGVQGGHVLDGDARNVEPLHALGVRMLALAHVMDNDVVGSNTGRRRGGLSGLGREVVVECERVGIVVDLAHMSSAGIRDTVPVLRRPFLLSHTGFSELSGRASRWRRYSPANRNVSTDDALLVADAGGVIGIVLSTMLLGGADLATVVRTFRWAVETLGPEHVAIGSDFDGGLQTPFDARGLPALTQALLGDGMSHATVEGILGRNALRALTAVGR
ncbi:MAG: membrane dipeptidase [Chloroflexi bacterium]|nr:membrane dipeptidase [Chloroflexota bacterium]